MTGHDDAELLERWQHGDAEAGAALVSRHAEAVAAFFRKQTPLHGEDVAQATLVRVIERKQRIRDFRPYLWQVARSMLYRYLRNRPRHSYEELSIVPLVDDSPPPPEAMELGARLERLAWALRMLTPKQQRIIELHYWEDMRPREIAAIYGIAEPTARLWLFRARQALRDLLEAA